MGFDDDQFRAAGDALDRASHAQRGVPTVSEVPGRSRERTPWAGIAAAALVIAVLVTAFVLGGDERSSTSVADTTGTTAQGPYETIPGGTEVTTPTPGEGDTTPTDPAPTALTSPPTSGGEQGSGFTCLESPGALDVEGIEFEIVRTPRCSASSTVMLRMGGYSTTECTGPPAARFSDGSTLLFTDAGALWATDGKWRPYEPGTSAADGVTVRYAAVPSLLRPIQLPAGSTGALWIDFDMTCGDAASTIHLAFTLRETPTTLPGVLRVDDDAQYYGACGNETASFSGETWYPLYPQEQELIDPTLYRPPSPSSSGLRAPSVMPPGPGDDVGTFVVFDDGIGRYESDSGRVIWLTREPHEYNWVC